ncbi:MAG: hypothetical protein V1775_01940 [Bacteroidota bacterium]
MTTTVDAENRLISVLFPFFFYKTQKTGIVICICNLTIKVYADKQDNLPGIHSLYFDS